METEPRIEVIQPESVAPPLGLYSHALRVTGGRLLLLSGQGPLDARGQLVGAGDAAAQTRQIFANLRALVEAAGGTLASIVELTIYVRDIGARPAISEIRRELFRPPFPATTMVEISRLAVEEWLIEISAVAVV
jgi:enamine deaminase RidA (YjgF/YER057c/UK114 family)